MTVSTVEVKTLTEKVARLSENIGREAVLQRILIENNGIELNKFVSDIVKEERIQIRADTLASDLVKEAENDLNMTAYIYYWGCYEKEKIYFVPLFAAGELKSRLAFEHSPRKTVDLSDAIVHIFKQEEVKGTRPAQFFNYLVKLRKEDHALEEFIQCVNEKKREYRVDKDFVGLLKDYLIHYYEDFDHQELTTNLLSKKSREKLIKWGIINTYSRPPRQEPPKPWEVKKENNRLNFLAAVKSRDFEEKFLMEQVLSLYIGNGVSHRGKKMTFLKKLLQFSLEFSRFAEVRTNKIANWTIQKGYIPLFYHTLTKHYLENRTKGCCPSLDAMEIMGN